MTRPADKPNSKAQTTRVMCAISASALPIPGAVIVPAFGDPGADGLQARLTCPVVDIGAGGICRWRGLCGGDHDPGAGPDDRQPDAGQGFRRALSGLFLSQGDPLALMHDPEALDSALLDAIRRAAAAGAAHVIIGGGPLGASAERLRPRAPVHLFNPILCAAQEVAAHLQETP